MTCYIDKSGAIVQVTGRMCDFDTDSRTVSILVEPDEIFVIEEAPRPGSKILHRKNGNAHTIVQAYRNSVKTDADSIVYWHDVGNLTPEKAAELQDKQKKEQEEEWRKQAAEIPVELLLESIKERIKK